MKSSLKFDNDCDVTLTLFKPGFSCCTFKLIAEVSAQLENLKNLGMRMSGFQNGSKKSRKSQGISRKQWKSRKVQGIYRKY